MTVWMRGRGPALDLLSGRFSRTIATPRGAAGAIAAGLVLVALLIHSPVAVTFLIAVSPCGAIAFAASVVNSNETMVQDCLS